MGSTVDVEMRLSKVVIVAHKITKRIARPRRTERFQLEDKFGEVEIARIRQRSRYEAAKEDSVKRDPQM